jgi:hypothetical protein
VREWSLSLLSLNNQEISKEAHPSCLGMFATFTCLVN